MARSGRKLPSGRHGLSHGFVVTNQRERMLAAVADGVAEKGYAALTVEDVIRLAGVSRRTFYDQFKDKREAFFAAYDASVEQCMLAAASAFGSAGDWPQQVRLGLAAALRFLAEDPAFARMGIVEMPMAGPEGEARHLAAKAGFEVFLAPGERAAGRPVPPLLPRTVGAGIVEMIYARVVRGRARELTELLPAATFHCLAPYLGLAVAREQAKAAESMVAGP